MGAEDPHPDDQQLNDAIDSLLSEDVSAPVEDAETPAAEGDAGASEAAEASGDEAGADAGSSESGDMALEAMDSVEHNAQSLIEDAIDTLMDDSAAAEAETEADAEAVAGEEAEPLDTADDGDEAPATPEALLDDSDGVMSLEELSAELDALEDGEELATNLAGEIEDLEALPDEPVDADDPLVEDSAEVEAESDAETEPEAEAEAEAEAESDAIAADEIVAEATDEAGADDALDDGPSDEADAADDVVAEVEAVEEAGADRSDAAALSDDELLSSIAEDLIEDAEIASDAVSGAEDEVANEAVADEPDAAADDVDAEAVAAQPIDESVLDDVLDAVGDLIEENGAPEADNAQDNAQEAVPTEAELEDASSLADLDASLAGIGDDILSGDFETPDGELLSADAIGDGDASALLEQLQLDDLDLSAGKAAVAPEQATAATAEVTDEAVETPTPAATAEQASPDPGAASVEARPVSAVKTAAPTDDDYVEEGTEIPEVQSIWQSARVVLLRASSSAWALTKAHGGPLGAKAVLLINKPIEERPAKLRDSIGYVAIWTALLAMILWVYLAFIRESPTPTPTQAPSRMLDPSQSADPLRHGNALP
ncbi:MAG: hypothetical protein ACX94C_09350 [Phycisphaerales bacterium]